MALTITSREVEGITVLSLNGRLVLGPEVATLNDTVDLLKNEGKISLLLDMKEVGFIDSTGLGTLIAIHASVKRLSGELKLLRLSKQHIDLLVLTKLITVFPLFDDEQDAIDSFFPDRAHKPFDILTFIKSHETEGPVQ